jgi:cytochrome c556
MQSFKLSLAVLLLTFGTIAVAGDSPQEQRHELMEEVGDAAKPIGGMLKEEMAFDADVVMESFQTWADAAAVFGDLFPVGSETGHDTEARATIWSDRAGFDNALAEFAEAVDAAIAAEPQDLESLNAAAGPVFKKCKACHEDYRVEEE